MAIKDACCVNCGSLIQVDDKNDKSHCMFCNCVFDTSEGMRALESPDEFEFPNEEQPEYEGPLVQQVSRGRAVAPAPAPTPRTRTQEKPFEPKVKDLPKLTIPSRMKVIMIVAFVLALGILAAVLLPTISIRNHRHQQITEKLVVELAEENVSESSINVQNMGSDYIILVLDEKPSKDKAVEIFNEYCTIRADVMELDSASFKDTHSAVTMRIASTDGGMEISEPENESAIGGAAYKELE